MNSRYTHFIVSFDIERESLNVSFIESNNSVLDSPDSQLFKIIDIKLSDLMAAGANKAKEILGSTILFTLSKLRDIGSEISIENDPELQESIGYLNELMMKKANNNEPEAQYFIGNKYLNDAMENLDVNLLEESERWYKEAEKNGSQKAAELLKEYWPSLKKDYRLRIEKKKQGD